jgi:hypothetical protein
MGLPFDLRMLDTLGPGLSKTLVLNAPVEAVVALADGTDTEVTQPYAVFSAGVSSVEAGRAMFEKFGRKLEELSPGIWITTDESPISCAIAPALGRAPVRLVCGDRRVDIENLLPYATRGLPLRAMGTADAHVELLSAPLRERYGQRVRQGKAMVVPVALGWMGISDTRISRPLTDILYALGDEVVDIMDDLDRLSVDAQFVPGQEQVEIAWSLAFTRSRAWVTQVMADSAKRAAPAPAVFFDMPSDAGVATYVVPNNPKLLETVAHRLEGLVDGGLAHFDVNQKVRDEFIRSVDQFASQPQGGACAEGGPASVGDEPKPRKANIFNTLNAWKVCAYEALQPAVITDVLDSGAKLVRDKKLKEVIGEGSLSVQRRAAPHGLPAGSSVYELKINIDALDVALNNLVAKSPAKDKHEKKHAKVDPSRSGTVYVYVVPDANRTWLGSGTDSKAIEEHLMGARKPGGAHLMGVPGLNWLRDTPAVGGGFMTMAHLGDAVAARGEKSGLTKSRVEQAFAVAPHHGRTPIPFLLQVRGDVTAPVVVLNSRLERALFEDIVAMSGHAILNRAK